MLRLIALGQESVWFDLQALQSNRLKRIFSKLLSQKIHIVCIRQLAKVQK